MATRTLRQQNPTSAELAAAVLRAWIGGNAARIEAELSRSLNLPFGITDAIEEEHRALLRAVARRMQDCTNLFAPRHQDPALDLCVNLLFHMVERDTGCADPLDLQWDGTYLRASKQHAPGCVSALRGISATH